MPSVIIPNVLKLFVCRNLLVVEQRVCSLEVDLARITGASPHNRISNVWATGFGFFKAQSIKNGLPTALLEGFLRTIPKSL